MRFVISGIALMITIIFHELAHGVVALAMGDDTAKRAGRLTLNPIKHISLTGLLCFYFFKFGWANPVPINEQNFKHKKIGLFLVSIVGVTANFIIALIAGFFIAKGIFKIDFLYNLSVYLLIYNVSFGIFNLLPFPPLDGSKILLSLFPEDWHKDFFKHKKYLYIILMVLIFTNVIGKALGPMVNYIMRFILNLFV